MEAASRPLVCSTRQKGVALSIAEATDTRVSCSGLKPRVQTEKQDGYVYEGDASLELHAASAALAGFTESTWEVMRCREKTGGVLPGLRSVGQDEVPPRWR